MISSLFGHTYPVPNVEPCQWNHEENSWPSVLAGYNEDAEKGSVHCSH